jgi:hypothetical protein
VVGATLLTAACGEDEEGGGDGPAADAGDTSGEVSFPDAVSDDTAAETDEADVADEPVPETCDLEDGLTPNHTPETAYPVEAVGLEVDDLFICPGYDDFYLIELEPGAGIVASIEFAHRLGDLDLWLFAEGAVEEPQAVAVSASEEDVEQLSFDSPDGGRFILKVDGFEDATGSYNLLVRPRCRVDEDCPCGPGDDCESSFACVLRGRFCDEVIEPVCGDDDFEPNGQMSAAHALYEGGPTNIRLAANVCGEDSDYYRVTVDETVDVAVSIEFSSLNDLDLAALTESGDVIGVSTQVGSDAEAIALPTLGAGAYLIYVDTLAGGSTDIPYTLDLDITAGSECTGDDDCNAAAGRAICQDGGCVSFRPESPSALGGPCDSDDDCAGEAFCYAGEVGFDDNVCTTQCGEDSDCIGLDDAQCIAIAGPFGGYCFGACASDLDCPSPYQCVADSSSCDLVPCGLDSDCEGEDRACLRTEIQDAGYCRLFVPAGCEGDDPDGNERISDADALDLGAMPVEDLTICDADEDWFSFTISEGPADVEAQVSFDAGADLDVFIYDDQGRSVGQGTTADGNPELASADRVAAGDYFLRVNQFPAETGDNLTSYDLEVEVTSADACDSHDDCYSLFPLRIECGEDGACQFLEGNGEIPLGGLCDSNDDCVDDAEFCFTFDGAANGNNICTARCASDADCDAVAGTVCTPLGRHFAICLPE